MGRDPGGKAGAGVKAELLTQAFWRSEEGQARAAVLGPKMNVFNSGICNLLDLESIFFTKIFNFYL